MKDNKYFYKLSPPENGILRLRENLNLYEQRKFKKTSAKIIFALVLSLVIIKVVTINNVSENSIIKIAKTNNDLLIYQLGYAHLSNSKIFTLSNDFKKLTVTKTIYGYSYIDN